MSKPRRITPDRMPPEMSSARVWDPEKVKFTPAIYRAMRWRCGVTTMIIAQRAGLDQWWVSAFEANRYPMIKRGPKSLGFIQHLQTVLVDMIRTQCIAQLAVIATYADLRDLQARIDRRDLQRAMAAPETQEFV